jgi:hypothetical protein
VAEAAASGDVTNREADTQPGHARARVCPLCNKIYHAPICIAAEREREREREKERERQRERKRESDRESEREREVIGKLRT